MDSYFADDLRLSAKKEVMEEEEETLPTELITISEVDTAFSPDRLSFKYTGQNHVATVVQTDISAPIKCLAYYFEMYVNNAGEKGEIAIGFSREHTGYDYEGYEVKSCGYIGISGLIYRQIGDDRTILTASQSYTTGDTIGCGINSVSQEFFFTKNGALVGTIPRNFRHPFYPTIVVNNHNEEVTVNLGKEAFVFDFKGYEESLRNKKNTEIENISIPRSISHRLVKTYLFHYGYQKTLTAFSMATKDESHMTQAEADALHQRKRLRELIMIGNIDDAGEELDATHPELLEHGSEVCFLLVCQKIIELVRIGDIEAADNYWKEQFKFFSDSSVLKEIVEDCSALLEHQISEGSGVEYLSGDMQKEVVADAVNAAILSSVPDNQDQLHSHLERFLRQLEATSSLYRGTALSEYTS